MSLAVQSAFRIGPIATIRRMSGPLSIWPLFPKALGGLERSGSIALPDRIHRFIPLVANGPRHYLALRDDTETESSRGAGRSRAPSYLKEDGMTVDTGRRNALLGFSSVALGVAALAAGPAHAEAASRVVPQ